MIFDLDTIFGFPRFWRLGYRQGQPTPSRRHSKKYTKAYADQRQKAPQNRTRR